MEISLAKLTKSNVNAMDVHSLVQRIQECNAAYFNKHALVSDAIFDHMIDRLRKLEPDHPLLHEVGESIDTQSESKVTLPLWMGSMDKIKEDDKKLFDRWIQKNNESVYVTDKLDGVSALCIRTSQDTRLYTRGNGSVGSDISSMIPYINGIPDTQKVKSFIVRGELLVSKKAFASMLTNQHVKSESNARNTVSGVVNSKVPNETIIQQIDFVAYEWISPTHTTEPALVPKQQMHKLESVGFIPCHYEPLEHASMAALRGVLQRRKLESAYEIDGIVVIANGSHMRNTKGNPSYAFAFKMHNDQMNTVVKEVQWNISKDKYFKPVVIVEPVRLSGVQIQKASGISAKFIVDNKIGQGAIVTITRSGEVIPKIVQVIVPSKKVALPTVPFEWTKTKVDIVQIEDTIESEFKRFQMMVECLDIKHLRKGTLQKLYFDKNVRSLATLFNLTQDDLVSMKGFQARSAQNIVRSIQETKESLNLKKLMVCSNILGRGIGAKTIDNIMQHEPTILTQSQPSKDALLRIKGISEITAQLFVSNIAKFKQFLITNDLEYIMKEMPSEEKGASPLSDRLKGLSFVFTGFRSDDLKEDIVKHGGVVENAITLKTTHLITKPNASMTSKTKKAHENGVMLVTRDDPLFENL